MPDFINSLNQKFELRGFTVLFDIKDSLEAENLLDSLDRATPMLKEVFNVETEPKGIFYLLKTAAELEALGLQWRTGEGVRLEPSSDTVYIMLDRLNGVTSGEVGVRELSHLFFNKRVNEREIRMRQLRTPSWLREGFALQAAYQIRRDHIEWLQNGWAMLQDAQKIEQLIKPSLMAKDINLIPDPKRRSLAFYQSYFMVKLLLTIYCDSFFSKYSTLMYAIEDMESEDCFRQITSFSFDKFFGMFNSWVQKTNVWNAME